MSSLDDFNIFNDYKYLGVDKINNISSTNHATSNKFIRILKDFYFAQDLYVKALLKINTNLSQLCNDKSDSLNPILNFFSITFCVFTNVQNEFAHAINKIVKNLTTCCDEKNGNFGKAFSSHQLNVISEFKNVESQLNKAKQKYFSMHDLCKNGSSVESEKNEKLLKKSKDQYQIAVINYNKARVHYRQVFEEGFNLSKLNYFSHLENMRKCTKEFGNALAKLVFDMKDSVQSLKQYYRSFDKEEIFQSWTESNKTISNSKCEPFPEAVMEIPENSDRVDNMEFLIDLEPISEPNRSSTPTEKSNRKSVDTRKMSHNILSSGCRISDNDSTDNGDQNGSVKIRNHTEKTNIQALKNAKKKRSIFSSIMKFKSTSDLANGDKKNIDNENEVMEENWQSRSNINTAVLVDDEGYIIRDANDNSVKRFSNSSYSTDSSSGNKIQPLKKLNIKPISEISRISDSNSELMNAAMQLPLPKREKEKTEITKKVSNLQRSTRPVSYLMKDKLYRRSMSVSELQNIKNDADSLVDENKLQANMILEKDQVESLPIACAITEVISSDIVKHITNIRGQIIIAFPLSLKQILFETTHKLPNVVSFSLIDNFHLMSSVEITSQSEDIAKLKKINDKKYEISIVTENLKKCLSNESKMKFQISNRISVPILEYFASISNTEEKVISCQARWALSQMPYVQFDFILASMWFKNNKPTTVEVKMLTEGIIEDVFSKESLQIEKLNNQCWKIYYEMSDNRVSVKIKTFNQKVVKLRMNHEFVFEKLSLVKPVMTFNDKVESSNFNFHIKLIHYRTMSTGNFSEIFEYTIP